jgi:hypothetical protein
LLWQAQAPLGACCARYCRSASSRPNGSASCPGAPASLLPCLPVGLRPHPCPDITPWRCSRKLARALGKRLPTTRLFACLPLLQPVAAALLSSKWKAEAEREDSDAQALQQANLHLARALGQGLADTLASGNSLHDLLNMLCPTPARQKEAQPLRVYHQDLGLVAIVMLALATQLTGKTVRRELPGGPLASSWPPCLPAAHLAPCPPDACAW